MNYEELRTDLEKYVFEMGCKYRFIAMKCNINESYLSAWRRRKEQKPMSRESYDNLKRFLNERK